MPIKGTFTGSSGVTINASVDVQVHTLTPAPVADTAVPLEPALAPPPESAAPRAHPPKPFDILELQRLSAKKGL